MPLAMYTAIGNLVVKSDVLSDDTLRLCSADYVKDEKSANFTIPLLFRLEGEFAQEFCTFVAPCVKQAQKTRIPDTLKRKTIPKDDLKITNGEQYSFNRDTDSVHV